MAGSKVTAVYIYLCYQTHHPDSNTATRGWRGVMLLLLFACVRDVTYQGTPSGSNQKLHVLKKSYDNTRSGKCGAFIPGCWSD